MEASAAHAGEGGAVLARLRRQVQTAIQEHSYSAAVFWADKCVSLSDGDVSDVFWLAQTWFLTEQHQRAAYLLTSRGYVAANLCCRYLAAKCHAECKEWEEALTLIGEDPQAETDGFRPPEGSEAVAAFCPLDHPTSSIALLRGLCHEALDSRDRAIASFKLALQRNVWCFDALDRLTGHDMLTGKEERELMASIDFAGQCAAEGDEALTLRYLYASRLKKYDGVPFEETHHPPHLKENAELIVGEAERLYYTCDFRRCYEITTRVLDSDPYHHACLPVHLACMVELNDKNGLFYLAHKLVDSYPEKCIAWFAVGCYYFLIGNNESARRFFGKATNLDVHFGPAWVGFGHSFAAEGEHDQAMAAYCTAARLMSGCHLPLLYIGMEHLQTNSVQMARQYFKKAFAICPSDPLVLHQLGVVSFRSNNFDVAQDYFKKALARSAPADGVVLAPANWEPTLCNLARSLHKLGKFQEAITYYEQALALKPRTGSTYAGLGYCHHSLGDFDQAIQCYHQALSLEPDNTFSTHMLRIALEEELLGGVEGLMEYTLATERDKVQAGSETATPAGAATAAARGASQFESPVPQPPSFSLDMSMSSL